MKAISYSLFGFGKERYPGCFDFNSYFRGSMINLRVNRVLYPGWINVFNLDSNTYNSPFKKVFDWYVEKGLAIVNICPDNEALTKAMLWRIKPVFFTNADKTWQFTHVLCRDIDSVGTYREAQAVQQWIDEDKTIHCITDSVSHNIPLMGGMIGFRPSYLSSRLGVNSYDELIGRSEGIHYATKGADQTFLNRYVYPRCAESSTEHFVLGMPHNLAEGNGRHYSIPDINIRVDEKFKFLNTVCGHIGSSGWYEPPMLKFLNEIDPYKQEYAEIEREFAHIFYWANR